MTWIVSRAKRPEPPCQGMLYLDDDAGRLMYYTQGDWETLCTLPELIQLRTQVDNLTHQVNRQMDEIKALKRKRS